MIKNILVSSANRFQIFYFDFILNRERLIKEGDL